MRIFRRLAFIGFSLSLVFSLKVFHKLGRIMDGRGSGVPSSPAQLDDLAGLDKTGTLGKLAKSQIDELQRLGSVPEPGDDSDPAQAPLVPKRLASAEAVRSSDPAALSDTNSGRTKVKVSRGGSGSIVPKQGSAVLVDSTGRRYEVRSAPPSQAERAKAALARLPALNVPSLLPEDTSLSVRKWRASACARNGVGSGGGRPVRAPEVLPGLALGARSAVRIRAVRRR